jgi:hypothetical protein
VPLPHRDALRSLFSKVGFHPLSVGMLARGLKTWRIAELGERLEALLTQTGCALPRHRRTGALEDASVY